MKKADDDKPIVDVTGKGLGVRGTPVNGVTDVDLDVQNNVVLSGKGMSVAPRWRDLRISLSPSGSKRRRLLRGALRPSTASRWAMGRSKAGNSHQGWI
jgi:hypothetical protein